MPPDEARGPSGAGAERLGRAFANLDQAVFILDRDWTVVEASRPVERIFGTPRDHLRGASLAVLHMGESAFEAVRNEADETLASGHEHRTECVMRRRDGSSFEVEQTVALLDPAEGEREGTLVCAVRDISVRKELERRLLHAEKLEAVGRMAGSVAHDFNNLVTVIRANMELMASDSELAPGLRDYADEILAASRRAAYLTRHLLAFSRRQTLDPRPVLLNRVLEDIARLVSRLIGEDVELELDLAPEVPAIRVDPGQIEQVIMNLAANARDAMPEGGTLRISTATRELDEAEAARRPGVRPGLHVLLTVRDTGIGMEPRVRDRAFEPFFTTKDRKGGTGLGLASVQGVVAQAGGSIALDSELGGGTSVTLFFPATEEVPSTPSESRVTGTANGEGETVLVVEDDPAVRRVVDRVLSRAGFNVVTAGTAEEAHSIVVGEGSERGIDLLLTDLVLPGATGLDLVASIQALKPGPRVLVMSGYSGDRANDERVREMHLPLLPKPFTPETLVAKVREVLSAASHS